MLTLNDNRQLYIMKNGQKKHVFHINKNCIYFDKNNVLRTVTERTLQNESNRTEKTWTCCSFCLKAQNC